MVWSFSLQLEIMSVNYVIFSQMYDCRGACFSKPLNRPHPWTTLLITLYLDLDYSEGLFALCMKKEILMHFSNTALKNAVLSHESLKLISVTWSLRWVLYSALAPRNDYAWPEVRRFSYSTSRTVLLVSFDQNGCLPSTLPSLR